MKISATGSGGGGASATPHDPTAVKGSFAKWAAARARGAANPARFLLWGDSTVAGEGSGADTAGLTNANALGFGRKLADLAGFQTSTLFGDQNNNGDPALNTYDPRVTLGSGWGSDIVTYTVGGRFLIAAAGASGLLTFAPGRPFNKLRLWHPRTAGISTGSALRINGVLRATVVQAGADGNPYVDVVEPGALGNHVVTLGAAATGQGQTFFEGFEATDSTDTPIYIQGGFRGAKAVDLAANATPWNSLNVATTIAPDYTVLCCTINDAIANTSLLTYYQNIEKIVAAMSAVSDGCLKVGFPANDDRVINGYYNDVALILTNIARDYGWSFYDSRRVFGGSYARATALGRNKNTAHPNLAGHTALANDLHAFLTQAGLS